MIDHRDPLPEAIAAFDAGNHAWGRFYLYTLRRYHGDPPAPDPSSVRAALQEAVLLVPSLPDMATPHEFREAVHTILEAIRDFIEAAPPALRTGDLTEAVEALAESMALLGEMADGG